MAQFDVSATVTSPPTDVSLHINNTKITMARDGSGAWAGKARIDLPDPVPIAFRAVGIAGAPWSLEIKFVGPPPQKKLVKDYKHDDQIPNNLLSVFSDSISLASQVTP
jgi:hypothetical protein